MQEKRPLFSFLLPANLCFPNGKIRTGEEDAHAVKMTIDVTGTRLEQRFSSSQSSRCLRQLLLFVRMVGFFTGSLALRLGGGSSPPFSPAGSVGVQRLPLANNPPPPKGLNPFGIRMFAGIQLLISMLLPRESPAGAPPPLRAILLAPFFIPPALLSLLFPAGAGFSVFRRPLRQWRSESHSDFQSMWKALSTTPPGFPKIALSTMSR